MKVKSKEVKTTLNSNQVKVLNSKMYQRKLRKTEKRKLDFKERKIL